MRIRVYQSDKGDCLLLTSRTGAHMLVDGGMREAFKAHVRPDLAAMAQQGQALDLVYVSHIDQDHISGILELLDNTMTWRVHDFRKAAGLSTKTPGVPRMPKIGGIWHNAFSMLLKDNVAAVENLLAQSSRLLALSEDKGWLEAAAEHHGLAFSVGEAVQVSRRIAADQLAIPLNQQFDGRLIMVRTPSGAEANVGDMSVHVIGPFAEDVERLKGEWNNWLRANKDRLARLREQADSDARAIGQSLDQLGLFLDIRLKELGNRNLVTPPNLASVMLLVEEAGKRVLLTGDGHADDILAGLAAQEALDATGSIHVDVLKVQHHGSEHNIHREFCERVDADDYVFCGNGKHENPDLDVLELLLSTNRSLRPNKSFNLWFNSSAAVAPPGAPTQHMKGIERLVKRHVDQSGGAIHASFLQQSSFDLNL